MAELACAYVWRFFRPGHWLLTKAMEEVRGLFKGRTPGAGQQSGGAFDQAVYHWQVELAVR